MAKFLILWRMNPMAMPHDPVEHAKLDEMMWAAADNMMKTGEIKEEGFFLDGTSRYTIVEGEPADVLKGSASFSPFVEGEVHEIVPYETGKEIIRGAMKAKADAMKKKSFGYYGCSYNGTIETDITLHSIYYHKTRKG